MAATNTTPVRPGGDVVAQKRSGISVEGFMEYLRGVREELKKAQWPTRPELIQLTKVVLVIIFAVATYCGVLDYALGLVTNNLFNRK